MGGIRWIGGGVSGETPGAPVSPTSPASLESESVGTASTAKKLGRGGESGSSEGTGGGRVSQSAKTGPPPQTEATRASAAVMMLWSVTRRAYHNSGAEGVEAAVADDLSLAYEADLRNASGDLSEADVEAFQVSYLRRNR